MSNSFNTEDLCLVFPLKAVVYLFHCLSDPMKRHKVVFSCFVFLQYCCCKNQSVLRGFKHNLFSHAFFVPGNGTLTEKVFTICLGPFNKLIFFLHISFIGG